MDCFLTIPLGISFRVLNPDMPFILRIGYVFIILSFVMIGISLMRKGSKVENIIDRDSDKKTVNMGMRIIAVALLIGIIASFFVTSPQNFALEAIYVPVTGFIILGLIMILNNADKKMDEKANHNSKGIV